MPKLKLRFTIAAQRDLNDIFEYLEPRNPLAANSVINAIEHSIDLLTEYPMSARKTDMEDVRVKPLTIYPFLIFYHAGNTELTVLRVWHSSREWPDELNE
jgi:plasmid stabilization system protein ParE